MYIITKEYEDGMVSEEIRHSMDDVMLEIRAILFTDVTTIRVEEVTNTTVLFTVN